MPSTSAFSEKDISTLRAEIKDANRALIRLGELHTLLVPANEAQDPKTTSLLLAEAKSLLELVGFSDDRVAFYIHNFQGCLHIAMHDIRRCTAEAEAIVGKAPPKRRSLLKANAPRTTPF